MPLYIVSTKAPLSPQVTQRVVDKITDVHCGLTSAPEILVSVAFSNGVSLPSGTSVYVTGNVRKGRDAEKNRDIRESLSQGIGAVCSVDPKHVAVYLTELPANWIIEHGQIVPEPGEEAEWLRRIGAA